MYETAKIFSETVQLNTAKVYFTERFYARKTTDFSYYVKSFGDSVNNERANLHPIPLRYCTMYIKD